MSGAGGGSAAATPGTPITVAPTTPIRTLFSTHDTLCRWPDHALRAALLHRDVPEAGRAVDRLAVTRRYMLMLLAARLAPSC